ncbi:hypothetical protein O1611_g3313 [Lasiodiplodia mahajangana]|uniref:Uncharacterized protein n=1 Tax=Lasiodiplodia mahajangana TaxID=1108764 RepID=A0ACC2JSB7_9PEZI|nr:hypothetical protein O1611_g3313 [Lasiodiplodia mahajangana]
MGHSRYTVPFVALIALVIGPQFIQSLTIEYCASVNTAATPTNSSIWQSNGLCHDFCVDSYAFAILQGHYCWCSDYVPATSSQVDSDECDDACPGWKYDTCGADGLYGYIALDISPSGTADGSTTSTSTDASTKTTGTTTPMPSTSVKTVTAGGTVSLETVTVTPTPTAGSGDESGVSTSSHGLSTGATVGVVVGVLGVVAILAALAVFFCLQRRRRQREEALTSRPHSHLSGSAGMMGTPTTGMASVWDGENTSTGRRSSRLMPHDPRMDPFATNIYGRFENKSRESINTLQDNQDYSRKVLRTTNPDPPDN